MKKIFWQKNISGLTIIEVLVTISVMIILSLMIFGLSQNQQNKHSVKLSAGEVSQALREVEEMVMSSQTGQCLSGEVFDFGVYFSIGNKDSFVVFVDCDQNKARNSGDVDLKTFFLMKGSEICGLSSSPLQIVFVPPEPSVYINSQISGQEAIIYICSKKDNALQKQVGVNNVGRIEVR